MIDLNRRANIEEDRFYSASGVSMRPNWWDSTLEYLLSRGLFLYLKPVYDTSSETKDTLIFNVDHCTHSIRAKTADEIRATLPTSVTMRQARVYLQSTGQLESVNTQVQSLGQEAALTWEYSQEVLRDNPILAMMGFTEEQLDTMFVEASKL